jgi:HlyD family secretion protein
MIRQLCFVMLIGLVSSACQTAEPVYLHATLTRGNIEDVVTASGTVAAETLVNVGSQVSGTVAAIRVDFGSEVRQGDVLAELDTRVADAQLARSEATATKALAEQKRCDLNVRNAERVLGRMQVLVRDHMAAQADLENAELACDTARVARETAAALVQEASADRNLARTTRALARIVSPIAGIVIDRQVEVGQTVAAQFQVATLFTLAKDLSQVVVLANVDEADIGRVVPNMPVQFTVDAYPGRTFAGTLKSLRPAPVNFATAGSASAAAPGAVVTYAAVIAAHNPDHALLQGMTAQVRIVVHGRDNVLRVPAAALRFRPGAVVRREVDAAHDGAAGVYVLRPNAPLQHRKVVLGISDGRFTEVIEGLEEGEEVVVAQQQDAQALGKKRKGIF